MKPFENSAQSFLRLVELMNTLRVQCPWDAKQTLPSLQKYTLEEVYELMDAINENDLPGVKEELGDVLFHTVFYSKIASETGQFSITDVIDDVHEKLVNRHPHVFGDVEVKTDEDVKKNWERIKLEEGKKSVLGGVPNSLPAIIKAFRIQEKAKQVGFEWENQEQVWDKVREEFAEFEEAKASQNTANTEEEFGDLLFSLVNLARFMDIDPEVALMKTNEKFIRRFQYIEDMAVRADRSMDDMTLEEMDAIWNEAKGNGL